MPHHGGSLSFVVCLQELLPLVFMVELPVTSILVATLDASSWGEPQFCCLSAGAAAFSVYGGAASNQYISGHTGCLIMGGASVLLFVCRSCCR